MEQTIEQTIERRCFTVRMSSTVRAGGGAKSATITGYAALINEPSQDLGGFIEIIRPGAFRKAIQTSDVRALWNHNDDIVLGRTKSGTLKLREDDRGLSIIITPPDTSAGRDAVVSIGRGDVDQMSFGFTVERDRWTRRADGPDLREVLEVRQLFDVSPVTFPAYLGTVVSVDVRRHLKQRQAGPLAAMHRRLDEAAGANPAVVRPADRSIPIGSGQLAAMRRWLELAERL